MPNVASSITTMLIQKILHRVRSPYFGPRSFQTVIYRHNSRKSFTITRMVRIRDRISKNHKRSRWCLNSRQLTESLRGVTVVIPLHGCEYVNTDIKQRGENAADEQGLSYYLQFLLSWFRSAWNEACGSRRFFEWNQPINPCHVIFVLLAKGLCESLLLCADENHDADIQKDRSNKIDPG